MRKDSAGQSDEAALVVTYGNTSRKHRPLDRDLIVLGRGRNCDIALVSPEVATVHCVIARVAEGWRVRDCTGRNGTRLNGQPIVEAMLNDGDALQLGAFSFEVHLPQGDRPGQAPDPDALRRIQRSRRNLAHIALGLRKRLRIAELNLRSQDEVGREADRFRAMQREWESRRKQQEQADAAARAEREALQRDLAARREAIEKAERESAERLAEVEAHACTRAQELTEVQQQAEEAHSRRALALQQLAADATPPSEALADLEKASRKLAIFARRLRRSQQQVHEQARELALEQQRLQGNEAEAEDVDQLRDQVTQLQKGLAEMTARCEAQQAEVAALQALGDAQAAYVEHSGGAELQRLIDSLRQQVQERDQLLSKMNEKLALLTTHSNGDEMADYEAELNRYRLELETDRREMNEQMTQLQQRQQEMEDALREAEVQMARERAQIAHEQAELNRLRQELSRAESKNVQDQELRERLAALRRPKEGPAERPTEKANTNKGVRLRNILGLFGGLAP
jgi:hypothetical protein